jgi:NAD dependent epimerase/dehydratase family
LSSLQTGVFAHYQYAMDSTILITGANGFIGSHFTQLMESLGNRVVPVDVLPRSADLSLLAIQTPSRIMNVTDEAPFRELCRLELHSKPVPTGPRIQLHQSAGCLASDVVGEKAG